MGHQLRVAALEEVAFGSAGSYPQSTGPAAELFLVSVMQLRDLPELLAEELLPLERSRAKFTEGKNDEDHLAIEGT